MTLLAQNGRKEEFFLTKMKNILIITTIEFQHQTWKGLGVVACMLTANYHCKNLC